MLSLAVDFDYHDLREREYPLLAAPALAERLRHVASLFPANPGYEFQILYRRNFDCPSNSGMQTFINTYYSANMLGVDYDIELGQDQAIIDDLINSTIYAEKQYPNMRFSFTLQTMGSATTGSDLNSTGDTVMNEISRLGLGGNYYVDLMAFDYGSVSSGNCVVSGSVCDMAQSAIAAAESLHSNFGIPYSHIELCLMIGQADAGATETLSLANVDTVVAWAKSVGLGGIHYWSFDRDDPSASSSSTGDGTSNPALAYNNEFTSDLGSCTGPGGSCGGSTSQPSFSLSDSPSSLSVAQGASGKSTITVSSSDGFDSAVSLSVSGLPSGVTASLSSSSVTPPANGSATSTLTLTASSSATAGTATVTITGTGGGLTRTTTVSLTVSSPKWMRAGMECHPGLHRRHDGQRKRNRLHRQLLDRRQQSRHRQRRRRQRSAMDLAGSLRHPGGFVHSVRFTRQSVHRSRRIGHQHHHGQSRQWIYRKRNACSQRPAQWRNRVLRHQSHNRLKRVDAHGEQLCNGGLVNGHHHRHQRQPLSQHHPGAHRHQQRHRILLAVRFAQQSVDRAKRFGSEHHHSCQHRQL
jgi:hypothetical protein